MRGTVCITIDVEDWFQSENLRAAHPPASWDGRESRVEASTGRILEVLSEAFVPATFFVLGWIAERNPALVRSISDAGHEVASHGYGHILNSILTERELKKDISESKKMLEDLTGIEVRGYRAPCFSVSDRLLEMLFEAGYRYDSSLNPFSLHDRYGKLTASNSSSGFFTHHTGITEFPMPMEKCLGLRMPVSGGGYFRLLPYWLFRRLALRHLERTGLYIFYMHPWEVDPGQPRTSVSNPGHRFRHYHGLSGTLGKLRKLIELPGEKKRLGQLLPPSVVLSGPEENSGHGEPDLVPEQKPSQNN